MTQRVKDVRMQHPKPKTYRNANYLDHVRMRPCLFCQRPAPSEAHHISLGDAGWGMKSSDLGVIPLCREHHRLFHDNPQMFRETVDSCELWEAMYWQLRTWVEKEG